MYSHPQQGKSADTQELRREAGRWLRERREAAGLSQREIAEKVGLEYYTFISQIEAGRGRIPPDRYLSYAHALGLEARPFARTMMRFYDPVTHAILFEDAPEAETAPESGDNLKQRLLRLEQMVARLTK
ncbi:transcriptional regulator [Devosia pacifica]|uniref:Transcriptional regulator n=1 Tax=Devosia pacifica TaxID=1335967 RepID=A0A918VPY9_9HYPH|nr:helix-turn-helix transcriptional regulator [Devosia pacifica]GHA18273.1 transcriptional regulator [Devosia pacifica]